MWKLGHRCAMLVPGTSVESHRPTNATLHSQGPKSGAPSFRRIFQGVAFIIGFKAEISRQDSDWQSGLTICLGKLCIFGSCLREVQELGHSPPRASMASCTCWLKGLRSWSLDADTAAWCEVVSGPLVAGPWPPWVWEQPGSGWTCGRRGQFRRLYCARRGRFRGSLSLLPGTTHVGYRPGCGSASAGGEGSAPLLSGSQVVLPQEGLGFPH